MHQPIVFLSRCTSEFSVLIDGIREAGNRAFPMLRIHDQEHPPGVRTRGGAALTVSKLHEWISRSDYVFLYVGARPGAEAKIPKAERASLERFLDPRCQDLLAQLLAVFRDRGVPESELTYTQLEGPLAIGLGKEPLVFLLEPVTGEMPQSQAAYRHWLREAWLKGRDRIESPEAEHFANASSRHLQALNTRTVLEGLARAAPEVPLWETVRTLAQPEATDELLLLKSEEVRAFEHSSALDWIDSRIDCDFPGAPYYVGKGLAMESSAEVRNWLVPFDREAALLCNRSGAWECLTVPLAGRSIRGWCFHEDSFWALTEEEGNYALKRLGPAQPFAEWEVRGFATHGFVPVRMGWSKNGCYLSVQGADFRLEPAEPPENHFTARQTETPAEPAVSRIISQFPEQTGFLFLRYFGGRTFEAGADSKSGWALVVHEGRISLVTLRRGWFTDAFQTVDVSLEGNWEALGVSVQTKTGIATLRIGREDAAGVKMEIPLFPAGSAQRWTNTHAQLPLLSREQHGHDGRQLFRIEPKKPAKFEPFCFVERRITASHGTATTFRVWLIPAVFNRALIAALTPFVCGLEPLPPSPVTALPAAGPPFDSPWWNLLWNYPH